MGWGCCIFEVHRAGHRVLSENPESGIPKSPLPKPSEVKTPSGGFVISNPFPLTAGDTRLQRSALDVLPGRERPVSAWLTRQGPRQESW